ncbi:hypothetical protein VNO78_06328 [Psophocarpus tetragonolobus]|uniref:NAD(P)H dehydrogenase (quinone) n=1 Tax=Psophocarpus tetragonolobus TaxID=3891 RepID=A0AAN9XRA9_PSOTE
MAVKIYIVYYSTFGHIAKLAKKVLIGVNFVEGVEAKLWQIPETVPDEELMRLRAPVREHSVPVISPNDLIEADGFIFCFPTRFGMMNSSFKEFLEATEDICKAQLLAGKPAGIITSASSQGGGQETTVLTSIPALAYHGMIYVPFGIDFTYSNEYGNIDDDVKGGSPYGAGTYAGQNRPNFFEYMHAIQNGKYFACITKQLKGTTA